MSTTTYDKPFKTYEQMIALMRSRHITISDENFAKMALQNYSYYSIINGYKNTFLQVAGSDDFIDGTRFEELYTLHLLDVSLNNILFKYIIYIEKSLKSKLSYLVSKSFGVYTDIQDLSNNNPDDYLYNKYYSNSTKKRDTILYKIKECAANPRNNSSLMHYINTKNHLPSWILVGNVPFGLTIEWYSILKDANKTDICEQFISTPALTLNERKEFLKKAFSLSKEYRNKIAHGNRTFSIMQLPTLPKKATLLLSFGILSESEYDSRKGQNDVFAIFLIILILINDSYLLTNFYNELSNIFSSYDKMDIRFNGKTIYEVFGLPNDILSRILTLLKARFN